MGIGPPQGQLFPDSPSNQEALVRLLCVATRNPAPAMLTPAQARVAYLPVALAAQALLVALVAAVLNQWFALDTKHAWMVAGIVSVPAAMFVLPAVGALLGWLSRDHIVPFTGGKIPGAGQ